jgi:hypothetical protein
VRVEPYELDEGEDLSAAAERLLSSATGEAVGQIVASLAAQLNLATAANASGVGAEGLRTRDILVSALTDADAESLSAEAIGRTSQVTRLAWITVYRILHEGIVIDCVLVGCLVLRVKLPLSGAGKDHGEAGTAFFGEHGQGAGVRGVVRRDGPGR